VALLEFLKGGSLAEYAVASIKTTAKRPDEISATDAAPLGVGGTTALQTIRDSAGIKFDGSNQATKNVLITAASGGVGTYAVQLAKLAGVHVTATCGARNIDLVKSLGADEVLDYKTPEGKNLQSPSGKKYDVVLNYSLQPFSSFKPQLAPHGKVIDLSGSPKLFLTKAIQIVTFQKQRLVPFFMANNGDDLQFVTSLVKEGKLKTIIDSTYPLSKAEDAWVRGIEGRTTGKIVVTMV
jgi:NADPH:quinone reductase-like Zn-dependent oxidoreductase